jgi:Zn-dependent protease with chaperone function
LKLYGKRPILFTKIVKGRLEKFNVTVQQEVKGLVHRKEELYFVLCLIVSILVYLTVFISIIGIFIVIGLFVLGLFFHGLMIGHIRGNGIRLSQTQFAEVYKRAEQISKEMGLAKCPDIFVLESGGTLNAFATRFFGKNMIVLYSDIVDLIKEERYDELSFVIAHELAHIKRNHIIKQIFILPSKWVPFLSEAYSRACEYTCDRYAAYFTKNYQASINSLTVLAIGKTLYDRVNHQEYVKQLEAEKGFFVWLAEKLSTHPTLPKRIHAVADFFHSEEAKDVRVKSNNHYFLFILGFYFVIFLLVVSAGFIIAQKIQSAFFDDSVTELMDAASVGDVEKVAELIQSEEDLLVADNEGWTALFWGVSSGDVETVQLLLSKGAEPNIQDVYGCTPLMYATNNEDADMVKLLLEAGADPAIQDNEGFSALDYARDLGNKEIVRLLQK